MKIILGAIQQLKRANSFKKRELHCSILSFINMAIILTDGFIMSFSVSHKNFIHNLENFRLIDTIFCIYIQLFHLTPPNFMLCLCLHYFVLLFLFCFFLYSSLCPIYAASNSFNLCYPQTHKCGGAGVIHYRVVDLSGAVSDDVSHKH